MLRCARNDDRICGELGRSMIEMLGVLAIIAVLSVGGIAGYSKAMEQFKINKTLDGYNMLIFSLLEHIDELKRSTKASTNINIETLLAINAIPKSWMHDGTYNIIDSYGNLAHVWTQMYTNPDHKDLIIDIYLSAPTKNSDGITVTENFSIPFCRKLFQNLFLPLHYEVRSASVYKSNKTTATSSSYIFWGDKYCYGSRNCMNNATPEKINEACNFCAKTGDFCNFNIHF